MTPGPPSPPGTKAPIFATPHRSFLVDKVTVYRLSINGHTVTDEHGNPRDYPTEAEAWSTAENWETLRCPTVEELGAITDTELRARSRAALPHTTDSPPPPTQPTTP